jgi:hypothetical protein
MMAWGSDGSGWDDAGDWAYIAENRPDLDTQKGFQLMTTWHDHDDLNEVLNFAMCWEPEDPALEIKHTLVLHVASQSDEQRIMGLLWAPLGD